MKRTAGRIIVVLAMAAVLAFAAAGASLAAKGGQGGKGHSNTNAATTGAGSFNLVLLDSTDGVPHWGQSVTFDVTSTATYTFVDVSCKQDGVVVYVHGAGFYAGYTDRIFSLEGWAWTGGAADCDAVLYYTDSAGQNATTLATMSFHVYA